MRVIDRLMVTGAGIILLCLSGAAGATPTPLQLLTWGNNVYSKTTASLQVPGSSIFAETAFLGGARSGGDSGFSYVWPASTQFRVENELVKSNPLVYTPILKAYSDELYTRYWTTTGAGGYRSGVSSGATRYYDDNAHMAVALTEAYRMTGDNQYLDKAKATFAFVLSGEDTVGGGGTYFSTSDHSFKDSAGTIQGARAALMLYQATGTASYLADATRLYNWAKTHTQQPDGTFMEKLYLSGPKAGTVGDYTLVNFTGFGIEANIEFYKSTGNKAYLTEAERIANTSLTRYFNGAGAINDEGYWAFELVDALDDLSIADNNLLWLTKAKNALQWLHDNREDPNGHYDTLWGRGGYQAFTPLTSWHLNEQASVAQSYLQTALTPEPGMTLLVVGLAATGLRRNRMRRGERQNPRPTR
jgi:uncharacterized protein YyaL (SSP411 family)